MTSPSTETSRTSPEKPAKAVTANTSQDERDSAPPAVSSAPSSDTHSAAGTSMAEGPGRPTVPVPETTAEAHHAKPKRGDGVREVSPPGERVDDEATGKVTVRQD